MGLFDFLKSNSKKTENETATAADLIKAVEAMGLGLKDFKATLSNGVATLSGTAPTRKDLEIARLVVGNHEGVDKVNDDGLTIAAADTSKESTMYTVKSGDTLSKIAKEQLGDAGKYNEIFEANRPMLKDPNKIYPGQVLRVPTHAV